MKRAVAYACALLAGACAGRPPTTEAQVDGASAERYLLSHQRPNGAFGPAGHDHADLAWNYPAAHALALLRGEVPRADDCYTHGQGALYKAKGSHNTNWSWDLYQRAQLARVLGKSGPLEGTWTLEYQDRQGKYYFRIPDARLHQRVAPFCDISTLSHFVLGITTSGGKIQNSVDARDYLLARQVPSGAFVDSYRPGPDPAEAHVVATSEAVLTLRALGLAVPHPDKCAAWIRSCQAPSGGFRWSPSHPSRSNAPDVWYTWAAVRALQALGSEPDHRARSLEWLNSLQNADGGFGDRPGWNSRLYSTYYAVHAIQVLAGEARRGIVPKKAVARGRVLPEGTYSIFQAHLKSPPGGADMVEAARRLGFHLLGVKTNSPGAPARGIEEARAHARAKGYPLEILACPEQYPYRLSWLGGHPADHVANFLVPNGPEHQARLEAVDRAGKEKLSWEDFKTRVIAPVLEAGSLFYPEMDYSMVNAYMVYDDGLEGGPGYNALIGALGWPVWDWIRFFPYRERWVGKLPIVADGDAHGDLAKWEERLDRQRVLYLAKTHDVAGFLDACRDGRTVCVIRGGEDKSEIAYYGDPAAVEHVKRHRSSWQWWK